MTEGKLTTYIKFFAGINANSINALMSTVDQKYREGVQRFVILVSSPGGWVFHALSAYNFLAGMPVEVHTHNFGSVDSSALVLFVAGSKRYSVPDARFLIHPLTWQSQGPISCSGEQLQEIVKSLQIDVDNVANAIARRTEKSKSEILNAMAGRTTLNPEEAVKFGIVHEIKADLFPSGAELVSIVM